MNAPLPVDNAHTDPLLLVELKAMQQFLHLAPVGLMRADRRGDVLLMNPHAARLMAPLLMQASAADLAMDAPPPEPAVLNLFELFEPLSPGLRRMVDRFSRRTGTIFENYRLQCPVGVYEAGGPEALGLTLLKLSDDEECLMAVVTDQSSTLLLERLLRKAVG